MKIAYAFYLDADSRMTRSGYPYSILEQLRLNGGTVIPIFPLDIRIRHLFAMKAIYYKYRNLTYRFDREPRFLKNIARQIERRIAKEHVDCVFAPGSHAIAELDTSLPKIFSADATFANLIDYYDDYSHCAPEFVELGHQQERKALANCAAVVFPSEWAANSARYDYSTDPSKIHVIPWGANLPDPGLEAVRAWITGRRFDPLRLLFIGREWARKGGDTVLETCNILASQGVPLELDLVGIDRCPVPVPRYARNHGLLDKRVPDQRSTLEELLARAHFLFVPSRAEAYGIVFCEAAAHGVPSLSTTVGGIPTIVRHGISGYTFPPDSAAEVYADAILRCVTQPGHYRQLAHASYQDYRERLNWDAFGRSLLRVIKDTL